MRPKSERQNNDTYQYYFIGSSVIVILITEEYFFPFFNNTVEYIERQDYFKYVKTIIIDFRGCKSIHGIGMGLEIQLYYENSVIGDRLVYWLGNNAMYSLIEVLCGVDYAKKIIPYHSGFEGIFDLIHKW